MLDKGNVDFK